MYSELPLIQLPEMRTPKKKLSYNKFVTSLMQNLIIMY